MRTIEAYVAKFNREYAHKANPGLTAFQTFQKLQKDGWYGIDIADHFGVAQKTVVEWKKRFRPHIDSLSS